MGGTRRGAGAAVAVAAVALAGAVSATPGHAAPDQARDPAASASYEQAATAFGACAEPAAVRRWSEAREALAAVRHWREVVDLAGREARPHPERLRPEPAALSLLLSDGAGPARRESVVVDDLMAGALEWAVRSGARAHLALSAAPRQFLGWDQSGQGAYVLIRHPDGRHFFAGACTAEALTGPARTALGAGYDRAMAAIVGRTGDGVLRALDRRR
jgi:hypothetical protein